MNDAFIASPACLLHFNATKGLFSTLNATKGPFIALPAGHAAASRSRRVATVVGVASR